MVNIRIDVKNIPKMHLLFFFKAPSASLAPLAGCCHAAADAGMGRLVSGAVISPEAEKQCGLTRQLRVLNHPTVHSCESSAMRLKLFKVMV